MSEFLLTLDIQTVGDKSAITKLEAINAATQKTGKAHDTTAKKAEGHGLALGKLSRALENYAEQTTGANKVTSELAQVMGGFALGEAPMLAILGGLFAVSKAYDLITTRAREAAQAQKDLSAEINRIAHLSLAEQGMTAQRLFSGDESATDITRFGIPDLQRQRDQLRREVKAGTTTRIDFKGGVETTLSADARRSAAALKEVEDRLNRIVPLYNSIVGVAGRGGTLERAARLAAASDLPGFTADAQGQSKDSAGNAAKAADQAARDAAAAFGRGMKDRAAAMKQSVDDTVAAIVENGEIRSHLLDGMIPTKEQIDDSIRRIGIQISEAIDRDPILTGHAAVSPARRLAQGQSLENIRAMLGLGAVDLRAAMDEIDAQISEFFTGTLRDGIVSGFETAFSGNGITGLMEGFFSTVLAALGSFMEQLGAQMVVVGVALEALSHALASLNGPAAIAAGVALIAAGAGLKAIASSFGEGGPGRSGGGYAGGYASGGIGQIIDRGIINPDSYSSRSPADIPARAQVVNHNTFLGHPDASTVRWVDEAMRRAVQQGSFAFAARGV